MLTSFNKKSSYLNALAEKNIGLIKIINKNLGPPQIPYKVKKYFSHMEGWAFLSIKGDH